MLTSRKFILVLIFIVLLVNASVLLLDFKLISGIKNLNNEWDRNSVAILEKAQTLGDIERAFGYLGLIHHFKNYLIRRSDVYRQAAEKSYLEVTEALAKYRTQATQPEELRQIDVIEATLNEYHQRLLLLAKTDNFTNMPTKELDKVVAVNDKPANDALLILRNTLLPELRWKIEARRESVESLNGVVLFVALLTVPIMIALSVVQLIVLLRYQLLYKEQAAILDSSPDGIVYANEDGRILKTNHEVEMLFGYSKEELRELCVEDLVPQALRDAHGSLRKKYTQTGQARTMGDGQATIFGVKRNSESVPLDIAIAPVHVGKKVHSVAVLRNISQRLQLEEMAHKDHLTLLHNRRSIDFELPQEMERAERYQRHIAVMLIDLDHFKTLNDREGHIIGDEALQSTAQFLISQSRPSDIVGRWGGDEFIMICPEISANDAEAFAERLRLDYAEMDLNRQKALTLSIGVASAAPGYFPKYVDAFLKLADDALYEVKRSGRNKVCIKQFQ